MLELSAVAEVMVVLLGLVQRNTEAGACEVDGALTKAVYVTELLMQALYELVLDAMLNGVGGKYCKIAATAVVPMVPQLLTPLAVRLPPVNPVLKLTVMLALSEVADVMVVFAGLVQRKEAIGDCKVVGVPLTAVNVLLLPMQTEKSPPAEVIPATAAGVV